MKKKVTKITNDSLLAYGFENISATNPIYPYEKKLSDPDPEDEEGGYIALVLTLERNIPEFGIKTPDGIIYLNANLEQLAVIEKAITGYSGDY